MRKKPLTILMNCCQEYLPVVVTSQERTSYERWLQITSQAFLSSRQLTMGPSHLRMKTQMVGMELTGQAKPLVQHPSQVTMQCQQADVSCSSLILDRATFETLFVSHKPGNIDVLMLQKSHSWEAGPMVLLLHMLLNVHAARRWILNVDFIWVHIWGTDKGQVLWWLAFGCHI